MVWFHGAKHRKRSQPCCRFYLTSGRWKECCNTDTEARLQEVIRLGSCSELLCALMCSVSTRKTIKRSNWFELSQAAGEWNEKNEATWAFIRQMQSAPHQWSLRFIGLQRCSNHITTDRAVSETTRLFAHSLLEDKQQFNERSERRFQTVYWLQQEVVHMLGCFHSNVGFWTADEVHSFIIIVLVTHWNHVDVQNSVKTVHVMTKIKTCQSVQSAVTISFNASLWCRHNHAEKG